MEGTKKLLKIMKENPELPVVFMVAQELYIDDDYSWYGGQIGSSSIREYFLSDYRYFFKDEDEDELFDIFYYGFLHDIDNPTNEDKRKCWAKAKDEMAKIEWTKAIMVWIYPK